MRVAIISDTHMPRGSRALPQRCAEELAEADAILHAGDWVAPEVVELVRAFGPPVHGIHGNVDGAAVRRLMPARTVVELGGSRIGMVHDAGSGSGRLDHLRRTFPDADAVVFGHTHLPQHESRAGFQIFNPGSPTERRRAPKHSMGIATITAGRIDFELMTF